MLSFLQKKISCLISCIICSLWRLYFEHHTLLIFFFSRKVTEKTEKDFHQVPPLMLFDILCTHKLIQLAF